MAAPVIGPDDERIALTEDRVSEFTGIAKARLRRWATQDALARPTIEREISPRNVVRLYGFRDAVEVLVVNELVGHGIAIQHVRRVVEALRARGLERPLRDISFAVSKSKSPAGKRDSEISFQIDGEWEGSRKPQHILLHEVLRLTEIAGLVRRAAERTSDEYGKFERRRGRMGAKSVFAGTRIPVEAIADYVRAGYSDDQIVADFPSLTAADIDVARAAAR